MPGISATVAETGEPILVSEEDYQANPDAYVLDPGAEIAVKTTEGLGLAGAATFAATPETITAVAGERVTAQEQAEQAAEASAEARYGGFVSGVEEFGKGAAGAATFGLFDLATAPQTELEREEETTRRETQGTARFAGTLAGSVLPGLLSGGVGAAGTLARLTPAGQLGALTTKLAARGGLARSAASAAIESSAAAVGDYIGRQTLNANPDFSASALVSEGLKGAALGGALGVVGHGLARAARKGADVLADARAPKVGKLVDDVPAAPAPLTTARDPESVGLFGKAPTKRTSYKRIVRGKLASDSADNARALGAKIDDITTRATATELDDIAARIPTEVAGDVGGVMDRTRGAAFELDEASREASEWFARYSDDVGLATAKKRLLGEVSDEVEDEGIIALQRLDEAAHKFDRHADELSAAAGIERVPVTVPLDEATEQLNQTIRQRLSGAVSRAKGLGEKIVGAAELAQTAGIDTGLPGVRDIPVIGGLASAYIQLKTGARLARKLGGSVPGSRVTQAAEKTVSLRDRITSAVSKVAEKGLRRAAASPRALRIVPAQVAVQAGAITTTSPADSAESARAQTRGLGATVSNASAITAARVHEYLASVAPRDPLPARPPGGEWQPSPAQASDWSRRTWAVAYPEKALTASLADPQSRLEVDAVRAAHPAIWEEYRAGLAERQVDLAGRVPTGLLDSIGRNFDLVLTAANVPGYGVSIAAGPDGTPLGGDQLNPRFAAPTAVTTSPAVTQEQTPSERRPR